MAEPNTSAAVTVSAGVMAAIGPIAPQLAVVIIFGAVGGGVAAAQNKTATRTAAFGWVLRGAGFAAALSLLAARWLGLEQTGNWFVTLAPVALAVGLFSHRWPDLWPWIQGLLPKRGTNG